MTQPIKYGNSVLGSIVICTTITSVAAWGTRFVSLIPTQDILPAAMVGALWSTTAAISNKFINQFENKFCNHFSASMHHRDAIVKFQIITLTFSMGSGCLVSSLATPTIATLAGRNISYGAAILFSLVNPFIYISVNALFLISIYYVYGKK